MLFSSLAVAALFCAGSAKVVVEKRSAPPSHWTKRGKADANAQIPLRIGLKQENLHLLEEELLKVSHPDSEHYSKHWTPEQLRDFFGAKDSTVSQVHEWLSDHFAPEQIATNDAKTWVEVKGATVKDVETLIDIEYHEYEHQESGDKRIAGTSYSVPEHVRSHIDLIVPTLHFNKPNAHVPVAIPLEKSHSKRGPNDVRPGVGTSLGAPDSPSLPKLAPEGLGIGDIIHQLGNCSEITTPLCLEALYKIIYKPVATKKNSYGIVEYCPQAYTTGDMDNFFNKFAKSLVGTRPKFYSIDGGVVQTDQKGFEFNGESNLDLQYAMALVGEQPVTLYQVGDVKQSASFGDFLDALDGQYCTFEGGDDPDQDAHYPNPEAGGWKGQKQCGGAPLTNVISTSYGYNEADLTPFYEQRQCAEYGKLGLVGVTMVFSSGDYGVAGNGNYCINADTKEYDLNGTLFNPSFPSSCPYLTSIGATMVKPHGSVLDREVACEEVIHSGGGFSNVFPLPDYQKDAVNHYFDKYNPTYLDSKIYNSSRLARGYPDISANGANYLIGIEGDFSRIYGTSASAPVVGAILTLVNDVRLALGKKTIGFINPTIYSKKFSHAFKDVTEGNNPGCGTKGFTAVPGWDPLTGLGTPNFLILSALWALLP